MDTGRGTFQMLSEEEMKALQQEMKALRRETLAPPPEELIAQRCFEIGEVVKLKGSRLRIEALTASGVMVLQVLPRE